MLSLGRTGTCNLGFSPSNFQGTGIFAAAMSDLSSLWTGSQCVGTKDANKW